MTSRPSLSATIANAPVAGAVLSDSSAYSYVHFSIGTETRVMNVVAFDRAAQVIFGCSAQEFFDFSILHPCAALGVLSNYGVCVLVHNTVKIASKVLVGELLKVTLNTPKRGKAEHLRMTNIVPMSSDFEPVIETLRKVDWS
ncbi:hypothetical protein Gogos_013990 [Gossypium gossypioides]|uniref:Replication factor A C-terminal domain-containing protein n=1 Tax=Gossypium gossypioides TaxID=34282 RepID=A0A7J9BXA1_GOSGO|nr:hypothetical protein [Gossypium gossypioides]